MSMTTDNALFILWGTLAGAAMGLMAAVFTIFIRMGSR